MLQCDVVHQSCVLYGCLYLLHGEGEEIGLFHALMGALCLRLEQFEVVEVDFACPLVARRAKL